MTDITQGPWKLGWRAVEEVYSETAEATFFRLVENDDAGIALVWDDSNARAISAVPDLLAACIDMLFVHSIISEYETCRCFACERTRIAIAKARGQS